MDPGKHQTASRYRQALEGPEPPDTTSSLPLIYHPPKNTHLNFLEPKVTSSNCLFCFLANSGNNIKQREQQHQKMKITNMK